MADNRVSNGDQTIVPYLILHDVAGFMEFACSIFGGVEVERMTDPDGRIMHAEIRIGSSLLMMGSAGEKWPAQPAGMYIYVADVDALYHKAIAAGASSVHEPMDMFYGHRSAGVLDPYGNTWWLAKEIESLTEEELKRRHAEHAAASN